MRITHHNIRQRLEEKEELLSHHAAKSRLSRGRQLKEKPCPMRTEFQRDRDRIIHCKSFRRLMHKTQVFIAPAGDHYRTRLTHTVEVSQIARTIARALNLNEDLTEAIALGHDLGHTPFGHMGEEVLDELHPQGFRHNEQSLRVIECIENEGRGLNLTWEVRNGILNHSKPRECILGRQAATASTLEGQICSIADAIAYINHDVDDAIRAGIIATGDLPNKATSVLGSSHRQRINTLVSDVIDASWAATGEGDEPPFIVMGQEVRKAANELRDFLFRKVYQCDSIRQENSRVKRLLMMLYEYYLQHPKELPSKYLQNLPDGGKVQALQDIIVDYISGMTDRYAIEVFQDLYPIDPG
jgi:dGTPase